MAVTVLQRKASTQQIGLLLAPAIKGAVYINIHYFYSQPELTTLYNENIGGQWASLGLHLYNGRRYNPGYYLPLIEKATGNRSCTGCRSVPATMTLKRDAPAHYLSRLLWEREWRSILSAIKWYLHVCRFQRHRSYINSQSCGKQTV